MISSINLTDTAGGSFPKKSSASSLEIQSTFGIMAHGHEPSCGLGRSMTPDAQQEIITHG